MSVAISTSQNVIRDERMSDPTKPEHPARRLVLAGGVQGLGVRPAIYRLAVEMGLSGTVRNSSRGVEIEIEGPPSILKSFEICLSRVLPAAACLSRIESTSVAPFGHSGFTIVNDPSDGPLATRVPADRSVCSDCLRELGQPSDRRRDYPFTSCALCGPRYTVIRLMPFEREDTAMDAFPLCEDCRREYCRPRDRRFHAQTIACPTCGPNVWSHEGGGRLRGIDAIKSTVHALASGKIVALRGLGGYQLLVDATNETAVRRLRERKGRRAKPLAVMVSSVEAAERLAHLNDQETSALFDPSGPIVLARARSKNGVAAAIHPHLDTLGLMMPTTPVHAILAHSIGRPLVCTSGNSEGDSLEYEAGKADQRLAGVCDTWLHHNREIVRPIDDSVVRVMDGRPVTMRLARGLAPLPLNLPPMTPTIAVGAYLKAAAAWSNGGHAVLGPHIGDLQSISTRERFLQHLEDMQRLYRFRAEVIVHDMHPEYFSTQWALKQGVRTLPVQHHHAHIAAGMLEHNWLDRMVLGVAWDGTGYGTDGTIWGGEFLLCTSNTFKRVARLRPFRLPGSEAAIREPWRSAVSICSQLGKQSDLKSWPGWSVTQHQLETISRIVDRPQISPLTSSAGRLIDAAAALILGVDRADYDGQAAMRLEAAADREAIGSYNFPLAEGELAELDWRPLFQGVLADCHRGTHAGTIAMRFHRTLAHGILCVCRRWPEHPVVLGGGVFQSRLLTELVTELLRNTSQALGLPGTIPPNDGGIAAGQLAIAASRGGSAPCA